MASRDWNAGTRGSVRLNQWSLGKLWWAWWTESLTFVEPSWMIYWSTVMYTICYHVTLYNHLQYHLCNNSFFVACQKWRQHPLTRFLGKDANIVIDHHPMGPSIKRPDNDKEMAHWYPHWTIFMLEIVSKHLAEARFTLSWWWWVPWWVRPAIPALPVFEAWQTEDLLMAYGKHGFNQY